MPSIPIPKSPGKVEVHFRGSDGDRVSIWVADGSIRFEVEDAANTKVDADLAVEDAEAVAMHLMLLVTKLKAERATASGRSGYR